MNKTEDNEGFPGGREQVLLSLEKLQGTAGYDVLLHGDYCLPNLIMRDFQLEGFIDLGYGGIGDLHYDLYWGYGRCDITWGTMTTRIFFSTITAGAISIRRDWRYGLY